MNPGYQRLAPAGWRVALIALGVAGQSCRAQDLDPAEIFSRACDVYANTVVAERVRMDLDALILPEFADVEFRMSPPVAGRRMTLALGDLRVYAESNGDRGEIRVVHFKDPTTCVVAEFPGDLSITAIRGVLPPIPLPQVSMALAGPHGGLGVLANAVVWVSAESTAAEPPSVLLIGRANGRTVRVEVDVASYRLRSFSMELPTERGVSVLEAQIEAIDPGAPDTWPIDVINRDRLASTSLLRPRPDPAELRAPFEIRPLFRQDRAPWDLAEAIAPRQPGARRERRFVALVFLMSEADETKTETIRIAASVLSDLRELERALQARAMEAQGIGPLETAVGIESHPVIVFDTIGEFSDGRLSDLTAALEQSLSNPPSPLWTTPARQTIERLDLHAPIVVALIDDQARLVRVVPIDPSISLAPSVAAELERAILGELTRPVDPGSGGGAP